MSEQCSIVLEALGEGMLHREIAGQEELPWEMYFTAQTSISQTYGRDFVAGTQPASRITKLRKLLPLCYLW